MNSLIHNLNILIADSLNADNHLVYEPVTNLEELLATDYSEAYEAYKNGYIIYRGDPNIPYDENMYAYTAIPKIRVSRPASNNRSKLNYYTLLFSDILPSWREYPKRNRSFICTSSGGVARGYGSSDNDTIIMFPKNGAKVAICPKDDIWYSFDFGLHAINNINPEFNKFMFKYVPKQIEDLDDLNIYLNSLFIIFNIKPINNSNSLIESLQQLEAYIKLCKIEESIDNNIILSINGKQTIYKDEQEVLINNMLFYYLYEQINKFNKNIITILDEVFNPVFNAIRLTNIGNYLIRSGIENREVWTDSECLFVRRSTAYESAIFNPYHDNIKI